MAPARLAAALEKLWSYFNEGLDRLRPFDVCICNGDVIDGRGERRSGVEQLTTNLEEQTDMAVRVLSHVRRRSPSVKFYFTRGTPYHTGMAEDWENLVARQFHDSEAPNIYDALLRLEIDGVIFNVRHHIGRSSSPQGRLTPLSRAMVWQKLADGINQSKVSPDVFVRSHVHYYTLVNQYDSWGLTLPALQAWSSFGSRVCEGICSVGFIVVDVEGGKVKSIHEHVTHKSLVGDKVIHYRR
jgi:hypothetical protein